MKRFILALIGLVLVGQLCGCGAAKQSAADKEFKAISDETVAALSDKSIDPIRDKAPFFGNGRITSTMAPNSCPDDTEKQAINAVRTQMVAFKDKILGLNNKYSFRDMPQMLKAMDAVSLGLAKLYRCELTYQQYAEAYEIIRNGAQQDFVAVKAQIDAEDAQRTRAAVAAFGAALQGAGQAMQQQEAIRQANRPRQTTCRQIGNRVDCTTY
ncbi:hypothetical protein [Solidesulfovibrio sp.]